MAKIKAEFLDKIADIRKKGGVELRSISDIGVNVRSEESKTPTIQGYAAVVETPSTGLWWEEIILRGAFDGCDFSLCRGLFNHNEEAILGSVKAGTVRCDVDDKGLRYEIDTPDIDIIQAMYVQPIVRGDVDKSSFRFSMDFSNPDAWPDEWMYDEERDIIVRKIKKIASVLDVSPVLFPAYDAAESSVRAASTLLDLHKKAASEEKAAGSFQASPIFYM